jgi:hypothetical protein|eukprot:4463821-Prymnesium_polylepis.1
MAPLGHALADAVLVRSTTAQRVLEWLDCAQSPNIHLHNFTLNHRTPGRTTRRQMWRAPPIKSLCCFPAHGRCFRAVLDDAIPEELLPRAPSDAHASCGEWASSGECTTNPKFMLSHCAESCRPVVHHLRESDDSRVLNGSQKDALATHIKGILQREFSVGPIKMSTTRSKTYLPEANVTDAWSELHADYYESATFVFSSVLFLGVERDDAQPRVGGETGLADELATDPATGQTKLVRGHMVEPRAGRLVIFSGGGENYHSPISVTQGRRTTFHAWFQCDCTPPKGQHPLGTPSQSHEEEDYSHYYDGTARHRVEL